MKKKDIEEIWKDIETSFDEDESLDFESYADSSGWKQSVIDDSAGSGVQGLIDSAFAENNADSVSVSSKYRIIKKLESGGQSDVFLAERNDGIYKQKVVIKFISFNYQSAILREQFLQEMQLLADLSHPGVVPIIDAEVTHSDIKGDQPWLVLEYIDGLHIDDYCKNNSLSDTEMVRLIINLCDTLDFIHQRGVLHKDIKPSNILIKNINGVPFPVLIDFGIAQEATQRDQPQLIFATWGYSSPEQLKNITAAEQSDIYSLGVVFLQLLVGETFEMSEFHKYKKTYIKNQNISSDLKKVILKSTDNEAEKRYSSAAALRNDLNNWIMGFPLSFDSRNFIHILAKSVMRNKLVSVIFFLIFASAIYFGIKYTHDIKYQRSLTLLEKNATDELMNFMLDDLYENLVKIGRIDVLKEVVDKSFEHLNQQDSSTLDSAGLLQTVKAYINAGRVYDQLENSELANNAFNQAEMNLQKFKQTSPSLVHYYNLLSQLNVYWSQVSSAEGQEKKTETLLKTALSAAEKYLQLVPAGDRQFLWEAYLELGYYYLEYGESAKATKSIGELLSVSEQQLKKAPDSVTWLYNYSHGLQLKSWYEIDFGDIKNGIDDLKQAINLGEKAISSGGKDLRKENNIRILHNQLGFFYLEDGQTELAIETVNKAVEYGLNLESQAPLNKEYKRELSYSYSTLGEIYQQIDDKPNALSLMEKGLEISRKSYQQDKNNFSVANDLCIDMLLIAGLYQSDGQIQKFENLSKEALKIIEPIATAEPNNKYYKHTYVSSLLMLKQFKNAKPLIQSLNQQGMLDENLSSLLQKLNLSEWLE